MTVTLWGKEYDEHDVEFTIDHLYKYKELCEEMKRELRKNKENKGE